MNDNVLLTGGAGYIGSNIYLSLVESGFNPIIVDNFSRSKISVISKLQKITKRPVIYEKFDLINEDKLSRIIKKYEIKSVIHLAGYKSVAESVTNPSIYYSNNLGILLSVLNVMLKENCNNFIFSSSASIYRQKKDLSSFNENADLHYLNPYSHTKLIAEQIIESMFKKSNINYSILRYFNPAGAHESNLIGEESTAMPNNLFPYICKVATGKLPYLKVFGNDYETKDGTCIRDYIHITDLSAGHVKSLRYTIDNNKNTKINLGSGSFASVMEVITEFNKINDKEISFQIHPRRDGDMAASYADITLAKTLLKWEPKKSLKEICNSALLWERTI